MSRFPLAGVEPAVVTVSLVVSPAAPPPPPEPGIKSVAFYLPKANEATGSWAMGDVVDVAAFVSGTDPIVSVVATAAGNQSSLAYQEEACGHSNCWRGTLRLSGGPQGWMPITITATDSRGNTRSASINVDHQPPVASVAVAIANSALTGGQPRHGHAA